MKSRKPKLLRSGNESGHAKQVLLIAGVLGIGIAAAIRLSRRNHLHEDEMQQILGHIADAEHAKPGVDDFRHLPHSKGFGPTSLD